MAVTKSIVTITIYHNSDLVEKEQIIKEVDDMVNNMDNVYEWDVHCYKEGTL